MPLVFEGGLAGVFKGRNNIVSDEMPVVTVLSSGGPSAIVDVMADTKEFFQAGLKLLFWCSSVPMASGELTVSCDPRQVMILHSVVS